jgi:membrane protein DedA with SNARE-associated domain
MIAVFSGRMTPGIRKIISILAGIGKMNLSKLVLFTLAGSVV